MNLFEPALLQLVADAEGGIRYWPDFASRNDADGWFEALREGVAWQAERRWMHGRMVEVPRLLASCRIDDWPVALPLGALHARVQAVAPAAYNTVGLNLYRDGRDSVAMHNDKLHTVMPGQPIALVSLGSTRRMAIRPKAGDRPSLGIDLLPGSLLVMSHASQRTHEHGIPKTARRVGPRMSVVFRVRPPGWPTG